MDIAVIGGGAAGFFSALSCKAHHPHARVTLYEKSRKLLSKVKISGGGRCNVTNACNNIAEFAKHYPRGQKQMKKALRHFSAADTIKWFADKGVDLVAEADQRMFPSTNDSQTIVDCLLQNVQSQGIAIKLRTAIQELKQEDKRFILTFEDKNQAKVDKVVIATGGSPKLDGLLWLQTLGHSIISPVPSLFTFNMPHETIRSLMGVVLDPVTVKVQSTKLEAEGPLLITHWGMSGPAILKLSAWGARVLNEKDYRFKLQVNWLGNIKEHQLRTTFSASITNIRKRKIINGNPFQLPNRFWDFIIHKAGINGDTTWADLSKKSMNRLIDTLTNDTYDVSGKTTFKEEFVTCGGVSLTDINMETMESKKCPGMFFAGEVLDIDGITGGFNFQAAWTTGFIAGKLGATN